jgi:PDDEXK-like domain of unknown function (DUF3799)
VKASPYAPNTEGIFRMPAADYHKAPGVGKHSLDYINDSPEAYALYRKHGMEATDAMEIGTLCHTAVLEYEKFQDSFYIRPDKFKSGEKQAWDATHGDKPSITHAEMSRIDNIAASCRNHPVVSALLEDGEAELSMFARCPITGVMRKSRPDWITRDANNRVTIVDFKFVADATKHGFAKQVAELRYYVQHAYYVDLLELLKNRIDTKVELINARFLFVAVAKQPMHAETSKHRMIVYECHPQDVEMGRNQYLRDLMRFAECEKSGVWPDDTDKIQVLQLPSWVRRENAI